jgi:hypothetical protein
MCVRRTAEVGIVMSDSEVVVMFVTVDVKLLQGKISEGHKMV